MSLGVPVNFLSDPDSNRHEGCPYMICCGDISEVYIKLSSFSFQGFWKREVFVLIDSKSEGWKKIASINLESFNQILEKTRIQEPVQFAGR